ncbi:hypothetical protein ACS5PN_18195 [Roseateles sp. NT4]|uniref:hypothetical protein n=1 Tax=Roseateles sp. NT4 TaxID=3453715 RepID=UPI003EEB689E
MRLLTQLIAVPLVLASLGGCANFDTIRAFAKDGSSVAAAAQKDVDIYSTSCTDLRTEQRLLAYARGEADPKPPSNAACQASVDAAQTVAASMSVQLLIKYHQTLNALAGDDNWTLSKEIEALGTSVKNVKVDGQALASADDVDKYQKAFAAIADLLVSALREREAKRLLQQDFDWPRVLRPLRYWYGGPDGKTTSLYSNACRVIKTEWTLVRSEYLDYIRCDRKKPGAATPCEPLTASTRLIANEAKSRPVEACAPGANNAFPDAAAARVKLIDSWLEANNELRRTAFDKDPRALQARLSALKDQVDAIKAALQ